MPSKTVTLHFQQEHLRDDLSAVVRVGQHLWLASDETTHLERLTKKNDNTFNHHESFPLAAVLSLSAPEEEEIDIEGLDFDERDGNRRLWLVGSHSLKRKQPKEDEDTTYENISKRLTKIGADGNRFLLAYVTLGKDKEENDIPTQGARLQGTDTTSDLLEALRKDPHLGPFLSIPSKDNGFDIEGLAVAGERIFLGLRGPVLRGWAVILEVAVKPAGTPGVLQLQEVQPGKLYLKHFFHLDGLGTRDLCFIGDDLLILAGPTMELDGPTRIYRWKNALASKEAAFAYRLEVAREIPFGKGDDHAEGVTWFNQHETGNPPAILVIYDTPSKQRKKNQTQVKADLFKL